MSKKDLLIEKLRFQVEMLQQMVKDLDKMLDEVLVSIRKKSKPKLPSIVFEKL